MIVSDEPARTARDLDYRLVLDRFVDAVVAADGQGCIVYANPAVERLLGWSAAELIGAPLTTIQPPRLRDAHRAGFARYRATGVPHLIGGRARVPALRRDGTEVDVELALSAVRVGEEEIFVASLRDLSERVEVERQLAERVAAEAAQRRAAILAAASQAFVTARLDLPTVLETVARHTVDAIGDGCIIRLVADDGASFVPAAAYYPNPEALEFLWGLLRSTPHPVGEGLVGRVFTTGAPLLLAAPPPAEMRAALKPEYRAFLDRFGLHSALIVPLRGRDGVIGTLMTWRDSPGRAYTPDDQGFLEALADRAAAAIDNANLYREQVEARARVQALAAERALTLGQIADGVIITDGAGAITFVNEAARRLHGVAELGVGVEGYTATYHLLTMEGDPYPPADLPLARAVLRGETVVDAEWRIRRPDGTEIVAEGSAVPVVAADGTQVGAVLTLRDVTAQRAFQRQKDEFFVTASHDLKTPLTSIKGWAQVLRQRAARGESPTRARDIQALAAIEAQANGMHRLLEQLLDASRLQLGQRLELARTEIDLAKLAMRLVRQYQALTDRHELRVLAPAPEMVRGRWDEGRLEQIVANLLGNAVKYSPAGGPIEIVVERVADEARLAVRDEGIGIPAAEMARIFEQFYRAENATGDPETPRGLGLGLFSAWRLASLHGGRIEVESELGRGSTFTLVLPLDGEPPDSASC